VAGMGRFKCGKCDAWHEGPPLHYGPAAPAHYYLIPDAEREQRCELNSDQCMIDGEHFYIVGNVDIPVIGSDEMFSWDVWVSLSKESMGRVVQLWESPGREKEPPYFGWFATELPGYPRTLLLKTLVHTRKVGSRPFIELEPTDHPLAVEQRTGITWERVKQIAELVLHPL
jgi:hypothetical protein